MGRWHLSLALQSLCLAAPSHSFQVLALLMWLPRSCVWGWCGHPPAVSPGKLLAAALGSWRSQRCQAVGLGKPRNIQEVSKAEVPMCWGQTRPFQEHPGWSAELYWPDSREIKGG